MARTLTVREYLPGPHTLVYVTNAPASVQITSRCHHPDRVCSPLTWVRLGDEQVYTTDMDFDHLGDWIILVKENGITTTVLKAKVMP